MAKHLVYDAETMGMKEVETVGNPADAKDKVYFAVTGDVLKCLLEFVKEDKLDISISGNRGRAVNTYVRAAVDRFIMDRNAKKVVPHAVAPTKVETPTTKSSSKVETKPSPETKPTPGKKI